MTKKPLVISLISLIILVIGGGIYLLSGSDAKVAKQQMASDMSASQPANETTATQSPTISTPGAYIDYQDGTISSTPGTKLLFFHAPWCPQCRALDADIRAQGAPEGVTIIKVDYDTSQTLRQKYGVTLQTTIVRINDAGELVKKYVAYDEPSLESVVKNVL